MRFPSQLVFQLVGKTVGNNEHQYVKEYNMQKYKTALITAIVALLGVLAIGSLSPSVAQVAVNCNRGGVLQDAIDAAPPNETILVVGTCTKISELIARNRA